MKSSAFFRDPYGYLTNQAGHVLLGLAIAVALPWHWAISPVIAALLYWLLVEFLAQRARLFWDGLEDTAFVLVGTMILPALAISQHAAQGLMLAAGVWLAIGYRARR